VISVKSQDAVTKNKFDLLDRQNHLLRLPSVLLFPQSHWNGHFSS